MFYFRLAVWSLLQFLIWFLFTVRFHYCRFCKTPVLPDDFTFKSLSVFWRLLLIFFHKNDNYLSILPLLPKDKLELTAFRRYIKNYPFNLINFKEIYVIKGKVIPPNFNKYKRLFSFFKDCTTQSRLFSFFFGSGRFFLKFLFFKKFFYTDWMMRIYTSRYFLKTPLDIKLNIQSFLNFNLTICGFLKKYKSQLYWYTEHDHITLRTIDDLLNKKKKYKKIRSNYFTHGYIDHAKTVQKFINSLAIKQVKIYKKFWTTFNPHISEIFYYNRQKFKSLTSYIEHNQFKKKTVKINQKYKQFMDYFWPIKNQSTTFSKFFDLDFNKDKTVLFLRKNKIFNKGRYSRNRQLYRTGVYLCVWVNIIFVYFYIFAFYKFTFNFGFLWVGIGFFILSMTFPRSLKYRLYNLKNFIIEFGLFLNWLGFLTQNAFNPLRVFFYKVFFYFTNSFK